MKEEQQDEPEIKEEPARLNPMHVVGSVFAAGFGVQSSKNRERDFKQGRIGIFITAGILFTLLFVGAVITVVKLVTSSTGGAS